MGRALRYLLDTNVFIEILDDGASRLTERVRAAANRSEIGLSVLVLAELSLGVARGAGHGWGHMELEILDQHLPHVAFDGAAARRYGWLAGKLLDEGTPIGEFDTLIAASALSTGLTLVTHNRKHFDRVPGLRVEDWQAEEQG